MKDRRNDDQNQPPEGDPPEPATLAAGELTVVQHKAIALLAKGTSVSATADELGVDRGTVHRWKKIQAFAQQLELETNEWLDAFRMRGRTLGLTAFDVLEEAMQGAEEETTRISAARTILNWLRSPGL
jgi:DNA-directed RNA polymerase specialized sigma24 family protein